MINLCIFPFFLLKGDKKKKREEVLASQAEMRNETVSVHDLLAQLQGKSGYSSLRKRVQHQEKQPMTMLAPLPKSERDKVQRKVCYVLLYWATLSDLEIGFSYNVNNG